MLHNSKDVFTRLAADMANVVYLVCRLMVDASDKDLAQSTVENIYMLKMYDPPFIPCPFLPTAAENLYWHQDR